MSILLSIKKLIEQYLSRMGKGNDELFKGNTPDCCTLNREEVPNKKN
ncbi:MAG: hypothetical protein LBT51_04660 [Fusobacteriaceae bacterium]|nr:hypothetical protein [Fusobacteriaceae bacterium]